MGAVCAILNLGLVNPIWWAYYHEVNGSPADAGFVAKDSARTVLFKGLSDKARVARELQMA